MFASLNLILHQGLPKGIVNLPICNTTREANRRGKTHRSAEQHRSRHYNWGSADRLLSIEDDCYGLTQYKYSYSPWGELTMA